MEVTCGYFKKDVLPYIETINHNGSCKFVSDFCKSSYDSFIPGFTYLIQCGTGMGKSFMVTREIIPKAYFSNKKVLLLVNRSKLSDQYKLDIMRAVYNNKTDFSPCTNTITCEPDNCLTIMSYQQIEAMVSSYNNQTLQYFDRFDIVIADEVHYFLSDSTFNTNTSLSAEIVLMYLAKKTRYFLSATMENIRDVIINPHSHIFSCFTPESRYFRSDYFNEYTNYNSAFTVKEYIMSQDFSHLNVHYYKNNDVIIDYILKSSDSEKWIFFVSNKKQGEFITAKINELYAKENPNLNSKVVAKFISSDYREENNELMQETMSVITKYEDTNAKVIVTTSVLDNGINIKSFDLKHVIIETDNRVSFIQMLGRRRLMSKHETFNLYISNSKMNLFNDRIKKIEEVLDCVNQVSIPVIDSFISNTLFKKKEHTSTLLHMVCFPFTINTPDKHETEFKINKLSITQLKILYNSYCNIHSNFSSDPDTAFILEQLSWLGLDYDPSKWLPDSLTERVKREVDSILQKYENQELSDGDFDKMYKLIYTPLSLLDNKLRSNRFSYQKIKQALDLCSSDYLINGKCIKKR